MRSDPPLNMNGSRSEWVGVPAAQRLPRGRVSGSGFRGSSPDPFRGGRAKDPTLTGDRGRMKPLNPCPTGSPNDETKALGDEMPRSAHVSRRNNADTEPNSSRSSSPKPLPPASNPIGLDQNRRLTSAL